jgi:peptidoglycan hydrolase-like protein with peptidoglycan-binding domain
VQRKFVFALGVALCTILVGCSPFEPSASSTKVGASPTTVSTGRAQSQTNNSTSSKAGGPLSHTPPSTLGKTTGKQNGRTHSVATQPPKPLILSLGSQGANVEKLQEMLAVTGYLPLTWTMGSASPGGTKNTGASASTTSSLTPGASTSNAAVTSQMPAQSQVPAGTWRWKYTSTPKSLVALWSPTKYTLLTKSAVMTFEQVHHLVADGVAGPQVLSALASDVRNHRQSPVGFSYVQVSLGIPQSLSLWHNGSVVIHSPANGGIPQSPTVIGTFPVYLQYRTQTMKGTTPSGQHYSDPGIPYVSYFYGGEAVHGFIRASYGYPQSLGCVELPVATAARVWPYMHLGTLVNIS